MEALRQLGQDRGLLAEALSRLEQEDPEWRKQFDELYETSRSNGEDDFVRAAPGPGWDPED